jgi:hypothetical protein
MIVFYLWRPVPSSCCVISGVLSHDRVWSLVSCPIFMLFYLWCPVSWSCLISGLIYHLHIWSLVSYLMIVFDLWRPVPSSSLVSCLIIVFDLWCNIPSSCLISGVLSHDLHLWCPVSLSCLISGVIYHLHVWSLVSYLLLRFGEINVFLFIYFMNRVWSLVSCPMIMFDLWRPVSWWRVISGVLSPARVWFIMLRTPFIYKFVTINPCQFPP